MRLTLTDVGGLDTTTRLATLACYLDVDADQTKQRSGILADVGLDDTGRVDVSLLNPFALVQFRLADGRGFPLELPMRPPPMLVHKVGGEDWTLDGPPVVVAALKNGIPIERADLDTRILRLVPNDRLRVSYRIDRLLDSTNPDGEVEIPAGTYWVGCLATLIDAERTSESRILQSGEIEVRLG